MSTFTMPFKQYIEVMGGKIEQDDDGTFVLSGAAIGLESYPIFQEEYRASLNSKIIAHYLNREIGMETPDMFRLALRRRLNEEMPLFNKLYDSELIDFDPLSTVDITNTSNSMNLVENKNVASNDSSSTTDAKSRSVSSETPQIALSGNGDYATAAADANGQTVVGSNATEEGTFNSEGTSEVVSTTKGFQGVASDLLMRYRATLLNIDMMVVESLADCFMQVWDNGDEYSERGFYFV